MILRFGFILIITTILNCSFSQISVYQDVFKGGVTGDAYNPWTTPAQGQFDVHIEPGSTIRKALLFMSAYYSPEEAGMVFFNGNSINVSTNNAVGPKYIHQSGSDIRQIQTLMFDVSNLINPNQNTYLISVNQPNSSIPNYGMYVEFYLYVAYENPLLDRVCALTTTNNIQPGPMMDYNFTNINPMDTTENIGLALHASSFCDTIEDGSYVLIEGNNIGLIGGDDDHSPVYCNGVIGSFYYQNYNLFGLGNDIPNNIMLGTDAIANIESYLIALNSINISFQYQSNFRPYSNQINQLFLTYTTPCQEFTTTLNTTDTSLSRGDTVQLQVSGGNTALTKPAYEWLPQRGLSCYDCPNPMASPDSSTTYTVRIWNTDSCSKVLPVRVRVKDVPDYSYTTHNFICGGNKGALTFSVNGNDTYTYQVGTEVQSSPTFNFLTTGNTFIKVTGANGCSAGEIANLQGENDVVANFTAEPPEGEAPLNVWFNNQSENAHFYDWHMNTDTLLDENPSMRFDTIGVYPITLIACKKVNECCDTASYNLVVHPEVSAFVPNIITPNGDGVNDQFRAELRGATDAQMQIRNRWGNPMGQDKATGTITNNGYYLELFWNGYTQGKRVPNGVYFYAITYTDWRGEEQNITGSFQVVVE